MRQPRELSNYLIYHYKEGAKVMTKFSAAYHFTALQPTKTQTLTLSEMKGRNKSKKHANPSGLNDSSISARKRVSFETLGMPFDEHVRTSPTNSRETATMFTLENATTQVNNSSIR